MDSMKAALGKEVEAIANDLFVVSEYLYKKPGNRVPGIQAVEYLGRFLKNADFEWKGDRRVKTAFLARPRTTLETPCLCLACRIRRFAGRRPRLRAQPDSCRQPGGAVALRRHLDSLQGSLAVVGTLRKKGGAERFSLPNRGLF